MWKACIGSALVVLGLICLAGTVSLLHQAAVVASDSLPALGPPGALAATPDRVKDEAVIRMQAGQEAAAVDRRNALGVWLPTGIIATGVGIFLVVSRRRSIRRAREST